MVPVVPVSMSIFPQALLSPVRQGTCSLLSCFVAVGWTVRPRHQVGHGNLITIMGSSISGFTNRASTFLLSTILGSSISGTPGSSIITIHYIHPGAAWAAMLPHQDSPLLGPVGGVFTISFLLPVKNHFTQHTFWGFCTP